MHFTCTHKFTNLKVYLHRSDDMWARCVKWDGINEQMNMYTAQRRQYSKKFARRDHKTIVTKISRIFICLVLVLVFFFFFVLCCRCLLYLTTNKYLFLCSRRAPINFIKQIYIKPHIDTIHDTLRVRTFRNGSNWQNGISGCSTINGNHWSLKDFDWLWRDRELNK